MTCSLSRSQKERSERPVAVVTTQTSCSAARRRLAGWLSGLDRTQRGSDRDTDRDVVQRGADSDADGDSDRDPCSYRRVVPWMVRVRTALSFDGELDAN
jgi:hypothetical protein